MESQKMSQKSFSEYLEKSQGTISSIFTGRTRPTLDLIEAIKQKFPQVSINWLLFGQGDMFLTDPNAEGEPSAASSSPEAEPMLNFEQSADTAPKSSVIPNVQPTCSKSLQNVEQMMQIAAPVKQRQITEIRIFFDDQTWETFVPSK